MSLDMVLFICSSCSQGHKDWGGAASLRFGLRAAGVQGTPWEELHVLVREQSILFVLTVYMK